MEETLCYYKGSHLEELGENISSYLESQCTYIFLGQKFPKKIGHFKKENQTDGNRKYINLS